MDLVWLRPARNLLILGAMARRSSVSAVTALAAGVLALASGGCFAAGDGAVDVPEGGLGTCSVDADCALAGPSCCACPTYALPVANGFTDACGGVECPMPSSCAPLVARCDQRTCVAVCAPVACDLVCAGGFAVDATGCLACACAGGQGGDECRVDGDCARAPADCCGCDRGGLDTAVPANRLADHLAGLMCAGTEACPGVSTCATGASASCQLGRCVLVAPATDPGPPPGVCGRPELPPCPAGQVCRINDSDAANPLGVGVCRPLP